MATKQFDSQQLSREGPLPMTQPLGRYLLDRLYAHGLTELFGVPGDYVLQFNKMNEEHSLRFINATRENTAGYMACAYARLRGIGGVCITYGVGINVLNAVTQAYVESIPLVVISGAPARREYAHDELLHHLFDRLHTEGEREHVQCDIFKYVTVDQIILDNPATAPKLIDDALERCLGLQRPIYIELPRDMVHSLVTPQERLQPSSDSVDRATLQECLNELRLGLQACKSPVIWAGHEIQRHRLSAELLSFAERLNIPIATSLSGRTAISERHPLALGVYQGALSPSDVIEIVEGSDCLLQMGVLLNDVDTGLYTAKLEQPLKIMSDRRGIQINHHFYEGVMLKDLIPELVNLHLDKIFAPRLPHRMDSEVKRFSAEPEAKITTARFFACLKAHLAPEHLIVTDFGDCLFGAGDLLLEENSFIAFPYFASIGCGAPGAVGAQIALPDRRTVGIVGDGAFQVSGTELSTALRYEVDPVILVLNNHGYGTERPLLEGRYNDIQNWSYSSLPQLIGGGIGIRAETEEDLDNALKKAFSTRGELFIIEVPVDKLDLSPAMRRFTSVAKSLHRK